MTKIQVLAKLKFMKYKFLAGLFFVSGLACAQYLEVNDIDIFINRFDDLNEMLNWYKPTEDEDVWKGYRASVAALFNLTNNTHNLMDEERLFKRRLKSFKDSFLEVIHYKIPEAIEDAFRNAGWKNNGNKKFWTIYYGYTLLEKKRELDLFIAELNEKMEGRNFDADDMTEFEAFRNAFRVVDKNITKIVEILHAKDTELIKNRFNELLELLD